MSTSDDDSVDGKYKERRRKLFLAAKHPTEIAFEAGYDAIGVILEFTSLRLSTTVAILPDGSVSIYTSKGGSVTGVGSISAVQTVSLELLRSSESVLDLLTSSEPPNIPHNDQWCVSVVRRGGSLHCGSFNMTDHKTRQAEVFTLGQKLIFFVSRSITVKGNG